MVVLLFSGSFAKAVTLPPPVLSQVQFQTRRLDFGLPLLTINHFISLSVAKELPAYLREFPPTNKGAETNVIFTMSYVYVISFEWKI